MMLLQVSNEHKKNWKSDYANRADPVYISRVVSAMVSNFSPIFYFLSPMSVSVLFLCTNSGVFLSR